MTVKDLIELLQQMDQGATVVAFNADDMDVREVTGALYGDASKTVELTTDDID